ncbi:uncharacterized protein At2g29880-like [Olea europaea var. sylvestris]|uniref:uncharacterized protein At2g29880-like n=1 Tax=Olea europaea var. sylvestris TaxID=158386 RepID=UPI000C1D0E35|nr:uncharacterized protein At2g29880-like [Olea europaea var. sylvestris]
MEDSTQGNDKVQGRGIEKYEKWTWKESNELLELMVDAATRGWHDSNGVLSKITSHPEDKSYRTDTFPDYEDLRIAVGSGTAIGTHSIALRDDTDARTCYTKERRVSDGLIDDFMYDPDTEAFIVTDKQDPISSEVFQSIRKRSRTEFEAKSTSFEPKSTQLDIIDKLASTVDKITQAIESIDTREPNCWNIIKEIPNLDDNDRFKFLDLLNTKAKNIHEDHEKQVDEIEEDDYKEALYETIRYLWMTIQAILYDYIGAIDGTHIPAMITGRDTSSYRNHHGTISQNILVACNFDLEFTYVISGWEE